MINSVKPLGAIINKKREQDKGSKGTKKSKEFDKYFEQIVGETAKEAPRK